MERLTRTDWKEMVSMECCGQKDYCIRRREVENACLNCIVPKLYARVAMFEDMELTYEKAAWMKEVIEVAFDRDTSRLERAYEVNKADKEGRVVVLPCKVGDAVYFSTHNRTICSHTIRRFERNKNGDYMCSSLLIPIDEFGKTVFLTREEAERALQEMEGKKDG